MTERNDHRENADLGAFLRSEVPEPGANYWDNIDAMLQRVEAEQADEDQLPGETRRVPAPAPVPPAERPRLQVAPPVGPIADGTDAEDSMQTGENVIRLTDMNQTRTPRSRNRGGILAFAAAALFVVGGLSILLSAVNNDQSSLVEAADDDTTTDDGSTDDDGSSSTEEPDDGGNSDGGSSDGAAGGEVVLLEIGGTRQCYSDGDLSLALDFSQDVSTFGGWVLPWSSPELRRLVSGAQVDGATYATSGLQFDETGTSTEDAGVWRLTADGIQLDQVTTFDSVGCETLQPNLNDAEESGIAFPNPPVDRAARIAAGESDPFNPFEGEVATDDPDSTAPIPDDIEINSALNGGLCYGSSDTALALDFSTTGSFTGYRFSLGGQPVLVNTVTGVTIADGFGTHRVSEFVVAAQEDGFATISTSEWTITPELILEPGTLEPVEMPAIDCADLVTAIADAESRVVNFPNLPFDPTTTTDLVTTRGQNRVCYQASETEVLFFDFTDDGQQANALRTGAMETISATKAFDDDTTYNVATLILGAQEEGRDVVTTVLWDITPERAFNPIQDQEYTAVDCASVADLVASTEDFLSASVYPTYPLGS